MYMYLHFFALQLMYYMKNVQYKVPHTEEEIYFVDGDVKAYYDIINWQVNSHGELSYVTVGQYNASADNSMTIRNDTIIWNNEETEVSVTERALSSVLHKSLEVFIICMCMFQPPKSVCSENCQPGTRKGIRQGEPVCCFDCIPCADGEISNVTSQSTSIIFILVFICYMLFI